MDLPSIAVTYAELHAKLKRLREGLTLTEVRQVLGGVEFKTEVRDATQVLFWRFRVSDRPKIGDPYELYMGTFKDEKLISGTILPAG